MCQTTAKTTDIQNIVKNEFSSPSVQKSYEEMTRQGLWKSEESLFKKYFRKRSSILDIGCGSGRTTFPLLKLGYKVASVDLTPAMIQTARRLSRQFKISASFEVGDATRLLFKDDNFDNAIFSFNGWDQIPGEENRQKALSEAYRVIKKGGYFIFTSHIRKYRGFVLIWIRQWIKFYAFRPLGFSFRETEYGDMFFRRGSIEEFENEQYIHIPSLAIIKEQVSKAGFKLVFNEYRNTIAPDDAQMKSGNCMFFVCRKK
jgi:ubiquinone/menaquinone biosynthesis C-methylase UbiE